MYLWFAAAIDAHSPGGVARNVLELSEGLRARGHTIRRLYCGKHRWRRNYLIFALELGIRLVWSLRSHTPDAIIARSTDASACLLLKALLHIPVKVVLHNHGWEERINELEARAASLNKPAPQTTLLAQLVRFPLLRFTYFAGDGVICGTLSDIKWLAHRYPARQRHFYIPNGAQLPDEEICWHYRDTIPSAFLCVGQFSWRKNVTYCIALMARLHKKMPNTHMTLLGCGPKKPVQEYLRRRHPDLDLELVPHVSMEAMTDRYQKHPFVMTASRFEGGHTLVLLEAMAHGCVVFASKIQAHTEFIHGAANGILLENIDVEADCAAIEDALGDKELLHNLRIRARRTAERNLWSRQVQRLERVIKCL
ncbi:MAG: glycosyltransferase [Chitinivibrionales bacterium]|nr:glycosyltransferase [Chitinivibrionales bacterium]